MTNYLWAGTVNGQNEWEIPTVMRSGYGHKSNSMFQPMRRFKQQICEEECVRILIHTLFSLYTYCIFDTNDSDRKRGVDSK